MNRELFKHKMYMRIAKEISTMSRAKRLQVGAIIVKQDRIISLGYNGTPNGWPNECENENNETLKEVLHSESNTIAKLAKSNESGDGAIMYCTHQPCLDCAKLVFQSGIKEFYYNKPYRYKDGVEFLEKCNIIIKQLEI